jgi:signal transduction histidine kinase
LIGLKEMVEAVNGNFQIDSSPGQGCVLAANIPL